VNASVSERTITAQTEILQGACVAGDVLPIKVSIDHIKPIKSMRGLIVTLYRHGRIDTHPAIPLGPFGTGEDPVCEDYYPRSRTGLGGLSLTTAGSSRTFRQDLAQTITPLIINPQTLTAIIKTSVQIPDHVFPTITCVPGSMVSFRYFVEVVIDLRGKLAGQDRFLPRLNMTNDPTSIGYGDPKISKISDLDGVSFSTTPGFNYLITDRIRRTKGVVFTATEVIVGTRDSRRVKGKRTEGGSASNGNGGSEEPGSHEAGGRAHIPEAHQHGSLEFHRTANGADLPHPYILPPSGPEEDLDEKAQIRQAEQRLLPSVPPREPSILSAPASAPPALDEEDFVRRYAFPPSAPAYDHVPDASPPPFMQSNTLDAQAYGNPGHVRLESLYGDSGDKEQLERQRLQALVSSPEEEDDPNSNTPHPEPSAPVLHEDGLENQQTRPETGAQQASITKSCSSAWMSARQVPPTPIQAEPCGGSVVGPEAEDMYEDDDSHTDMRNEDLPIYRRWVGSALGRDLYLYTLDTLRILYPLEIESMWKKIFDSIPWKVVAKCA